MTLVYADERMRLFYSPERSAVGRFVRFSRKEWIFLDWLWEGRVLDAANASRRATVFVELHRRVANLELPPESESHV